MRSCARGEVKPLNGGFQQFFAFRGNRPVPERKLALAVPGQSYALTHE
jgi:hypothetical protein